RQLLFAGRSARRRVFRAQRALPERIKEGEPMSFVAGAGSINIDLLFEGLPRIPNEGEELYSRGFSLQMGGGVSATLLNLAGLGVPVRIQTGLGNDMFSDFARRTFASFG